MVLGSALKKPDFHIMARELIWQYFRQGHLDDVAVTKVLNHPEMYVLYECWHSYSIFLNTLFNSLFKNVQLHSLCDCSKMFNRHLKNKESMVLRCLAQLSEMLQLMQTFLLAPFQMFLTTPAKLLKQRDLKCAQRLKFWVLNLSSLSKMALHT